MIISHIKYTEAGWIMQSNEEHQNGVAALAANFAGEFGMSEWGRVLGLLHDKGKERKAFQQHILKESGCQPDIEVEGDYNHAYVGALITKELFKTPPYWQFMDNILMGHHRGLYDDGDKREILKRGLPDDVSIGYIESVLENPSGIIQHSKDVHHLIRMLYSCLIDADYLDTEKFMLPEQSKLRGGKSTIEELRMKLEVHLDGLKTAAADTEVNRIRDEVQQYCIKESCHGVDFYSLTVPTGGGKTLSSVLWALLHAEKNDLKRVIIAIPYTSIIIQTASVLRVIFGDENVLEHHSNATLDGNDDGEMVRKLKLATENWDYPIIVTTNVQLFESLFSNRPSKCRKLHNLANSVLILDEVQTLPIDFLKPIVDTFDTLKRLFNISVLFTTASLPILSGKMEGHLNSFDGLGHIREIIPLDARLHERLRRVQLSFDDCCSTYDDIADRMAKHKRALCIVNTKKDAEEIYSRLPDEGLCFHLSRMMCPKHLRETIESIKSALNSDKPIIHVVATQLIEAGVDIDFPIVFRQEAGLDSILQAAGRCNREGKEDMGMTYVFKLNKPLPQGMISDCNNARINMLGEYDWFSPWAMQEYFRQLYSRRDFDRKRICELLYKKEQQFEMAADTFKLIDDQTVSVIINWKDSMTYIETLRTYGVSYALMKIISQYSVDIRKSDFDKLRSFGAIEEILEKVYVVNDSVFYDRNVGLKIENHRLDETYIV